MEGRGEFSGNLANIADADENPAQLFEWNGVEEAYASCCTNVDMNEMKEYGLFGLAQLDEASSYVDRDVV